MKSQTIVCTFGMCFMFCSTFAQNLKLGSPSLTQKAIAVKSSDNSVYDVIRQLQANPPKLNFKLEDAQAAQASYTKVDLVTQIFYKGKEVGKTVQKGIPVCSGSNSLNLSHFQVEKMLLDAFEKNTTPTETSGGRMNENTKPDLRGKLPGTDTKGFIRRQVGRIPKDQYEVRLGIVPEGNPGTTQPTVFLVNII